MSKLETNTIDNISGSTTLTIGDSNTSTIALKSGATLTNFPANTPAFLAQSAADQTVSNNSDTKVILGTEVFDTDNAFASSRFTVPSGKGGKYFFYGQIRINVASDGNLDVAYIYFAKNYNFIFSKYFNYYTYIPFLTQRKNPYYLNPKHAHIHLVIEFVIFEYLLDRNILLE